jgi:NAD dependent epimerase/dehydratase family enzyme
MSVSKPMRILMPGGSGQVGRILARHFHRKGHAVTVLSRGPRSALWRGHSCLPRQDTSRRFLASLRM